MKQLIAHKFYVLKPESKGEPAGDQSRVLGPFDGHRAGWLARCEWAYDRNDVPDRAELLTGAQLALDYGGRYGSVQTT